MPWTELNSVWLWDCVEGNKMCEVGFSWQKLFLTGVISKAIYKSSEEDKKEEEVKKTLEQHDNIVTHYKKVIREQVRWASTVRASPEVVCSGFWRNCRAVRYPMFQNL